MLGFVLMGGSTIVTYLHTYTHTYTQTE